MGNILKNHVECTCEEFVAEVAGKRRKPFLDALKSTFKTIVLGKSTLVKDMSSFLRESEGALERKRVQELMSGWLNAYDFAGLLNPYLLTRSVADVTVGAALADVPFAKAHLKTYRGDRLAEVRCRVGHVQYCADRHCKDAVTEEVGVLVVESRFDGKSLYLYVVCPDEVLADRRAMFAWAVRAAQAYCDRECAEERSSEGRSRSDGEAARKGPRRLRRRS